MQNLSTLPPAVAAGELLTRRRARRNLLDFTRYTFPQYRVDPLHELIADALQDVVEGGTQRLMVFAPPQHGKSELASVRLPAYWLGRRPDSPVIITSYAATLAESKSRAVRDIVESSRFSGLFGKLSASDNPVAARGDSRAVARWQLDGKQGSLLAVGVGGPVTGHGALLGIIDDPFENWEQAQSLKIRDKVWDWYRGTFRTRIWEDGAIVLIMTRWHEDDLAGRLLRQQSQDWKVLRLPALAESQYDRDHNQKRMGKAAGDSDPLHRHEGEALSPQRFSTNALHLIRNDVGTLVWSAEYQGAPAPSEGTMFQRGWFKVVPVLPVQTVATVRYWDKAATVGESSKYTAGVKISYGVDGRFYVEHVSRGKWTTGERRRIMLQTAQLDGIGVAIGIEQEPGSSGVDSVQDEIALMKAFAVFADRPTGDKNTRLFPFAAQVENGNVYLVEGVWVEEFIDELCAIPNGNYRDQSDAAGAGYNRLNELLHARPVETYVVDDEVSISPY